MQSWCLVLLLLLVVGRSTTAASTVALSESTKYKIMHGEMLNRKERNEFEAVEYSRYQQLRQIGLDEVSFTETAAALRNYRLRDVKRRSSGSSDGSLANFLFPDVPPREYLDKESIKVDFDGLNSKLNPMVPYDAGDVPYGCQDTPLDFRVKVDLECTIQCITKLDSMSIQQLRHLVEDEYRVRLTLDGLSVLVRSTEMNYADQDYPVGFAADVRNDELYLHNHLKFTIHYNESPGEFDGVRIIGFDVEAISYQHDLKGTPTCADRSPSNDPASYVRLKQADRELEVVYSYEIAWIASDLVWADRWDVYIVHSIPEFDFYHLQALSQLGMVLLVRCIVAAITIRILRRDSANLKERKLDEEGGDERLISSAAIFAFPETSPLILAILVGIGAQICVAVSLAIIAGLIPAFSPFRNFGTALLYAYTFCGFVSGYVSRLVFKCAGGTDHKYQLCLAVAAVFPIFVWAMLCQSDVWLGLTGSTMTRPLLYTVGILSASVGLSVPLVFLGMAVGDWQKIPIGTDHIVVQCSNDVPWYFEQQFSIVAGGLLPFATVVVVLPQSMDLYWQHPIYSDLRFLLLAQATGIFAFATYSVASTLAQVRHGCLRWRRFSFLQGAVSGVCVFGYSLSFVMSHFQTRGFCAIAIYLCHMSMVSITFGLACGSLSFIPAALFLYSTYGDGAYKSIKLQQQYRRLVSFFLRCHRGLKEKASTSPSTELQKPLLH